MDDQSRSEHFEDFAARPQQAKKKTAAAGPPMPDTISGADLMAATFPEIDFVVPGIVAPGVTMLAGRPKIGKSWLTMDWGLAVANGGFALGNIKVTQGGVLYLGLEDNRRRLQARLKQIAPGQEIPANLHFACEWPRSDQGGADLIRRKLTEIENPRLVIIDVIGKLRPLRAPKDLYLADYLAIEPIKKIADDYANLGIVVCHHVSKRQDAADPFDCVSGSTGLTGACDTVAILARDTQGTTLYGRGRDVEEFHIALSFDASHGQFASLGDADEARRSEQRRAILKALDEHGPMRPADIAKATSLKAANVYTLLANMVKKGEIEKDEAGKYGRSNRESNRGTNSYENGRWSVYQ
ncbi:AAA family ATPase [Rhizobium sp. BK399]|uniref:AAA family ATPase n=1 Tax=Rhizobium sp. BK399 TaxID=2587063 RepID=UPI00160BC823|nr:AAA family ATPase [Rhizobium sp. BK399]MBB3540794.1 hypothetical protein [Rhizobium sp. BK399]